MRILFFLLVGSLLTMEAIAQGDLMMLMSPTRNRDTLIFDTEFTGVETVRDKNQGDDFGILEHQLSLRYAIPTEWSAPVSGTSC